MGQKVNPNGLRVGVIREWDTKWYASKKNYADLLVEDYNLRKMLKESLKDSSVSKIEIERAANRVKVNIYTAKPGIVIGKNGARVDAIQEDIADLTGKEASLNIIEIKNPDRDAQLIADGIAAQLERRVSFRRAMKFAMQRAETAGAKGIKTKVSGRLNGNEIARSEAYSDGTTPLQTLRADIEYGFSEAHTTYGRIGVKVWIYKGEVLGKRNVAKVEEGGR